MSAVTFSDKEKHEIRLKTSKNLLWVAIATMVMLFIGFTSAYIVRQEEGQWLVFELPNILFISTLVIMLSSVSMVWATRSAKKDNNQGVKIGLLITLVLGLVFVVCQYQAWVEVHDLGIVWAGKESNAAGSYLYLITGLHLAHLFAGILSLIYTFARSLRGAYSSSNSLGLELTALYWHFLDVLWVYLFLFLYYIR
ncbi:MAG: cytochrome oxidase subunit III [Crocinitomicaceae bacterium]|nr:cytochrome oxidase subunit III [Crocinitomicaceae bacterium]|tara:strand:- start:9180 stop:9767 length:588 start_codon:yes stop_codon:yes gene_type:complete